MRMLSDPIPWPQKGKQLFKSDVDVQHNACLNYLHDHREAYALGYKEAGDQLVECIKSSRLPIDALVYPIVFLYRHYIELRLKQLIDNGNILLDISSVKPSEGHDLNGLWRKCREVLEKVFARDPKVDLDAVQETIQQFAKHDPGATSFRYHTTRKGKKSLPGLTHINLRNLADVIAGVASLLEGASEGISEYLSHKFEMEAEFRNEI